MKRRARQKADSTRVNVSVNGEAWIQVPDLATSGSGDPVYIVRQDSRGGSWLQFGDGKHGRKLPSDSAVVVAYYRENDQGTELVKVVLERTAVPHPDHPLWVVIRNSTEAIEFGHYEREPSSTRPLCFGSRARILWFAFTAILLGLLLLLLVILYE